MLEFDAIIIGLGLSGASAAISLAQRGARVLALESGSFPRHKVCGEFLSHESRATLQRLQVLEAVLAAGARDICRLRIFAPHDSHKPTPRAVEATLPAPGLGFSRWELDRILFERALETGVQVETDTKIKCIEPPQSAGDHWTVRAGAQQFTAKYLLATAGRDASWWQKDAAESKPESRFVGLKTHFEGVDLEDDVVELHAWRGGYCGLSRVEGNTSNLGLLTCYESLAGRSPSEFWDDLLRQMPLLQQRLRHATLSFDWLATGNVRFRPPTPLRNLASSTCDCERGAPVMCAGDAAGFIHPLTGDGMAMALRGGELAAACIDAARQNNWSSGELHLLWRGAWEREFAARLKWSRALQPLLIEPRLAQWARPMCELAPGLVQMAIRRTRGHSC